MARRVVSINARELQIEFLVTKNNDGIDLECTNTVLDKFIARASIGRNDAWHVEEQTRHAST